MRIRKRNEKIGVRLASAAMSRSSLREDKSIPLIVMLLGYNDIFGNMKGTTFGELIDRIPTLAAINFVVAHMDEVMYGQTDPQKLRKQLSDFISYLTYPEKRVLFELVIEKKATISVFNNAGCLRFVYFAMQNYQPMPKGDYVLTRDDKRRIYKALTYCNQIITDLQIKDIKFNKENVVDVMMAIDVPMAEFKTYKFFQTQLVKALRFFEFCERPMLEDSPKAIAKREEYRHYLAQFYQDMGVSDWKQYLKSLMLIIINQIKRPNGRFVYIENGEHDPFVQNMIATPEAFQGVTYEDALKYMRGHFLWQMNADWDTEGVVSNDTYLLLNSNLLVDRLYMGVLFSFWQSMNTYRTSQGLKPIDFLDYKATIGTEFAEPRLFYPIMERTFNNSRYVKVSGNELHDKYNMEGTSDYYIRVGDQLLLFEFKDALLGDTFKYSHNVQKIKNEVLHRICNPGSSEHDDNRKGVYQLMDTVQDLDSSTKYDVTGITINDINTVYPIVVITDTALGANGVNAVVTNEFITTILPQYTFKHHFKLNTPIVIHIDTLMNIAKRISTGFWKFEDMLDGYLKSSSISLISSTSTFDGFVVDEFIHKAKFDKNNVTYIFGDDLKPLLDPE